MGCCKRVIILRSDQGIVIHTIPFQFFPFCLVSHASQLQPIIYFCFPLPLSPSWLVLAGSNFHIFHTLHFHRHSCTHMYHIPPFLTLIFIHLVIFQFNIVLPARCSLVFGLVGDGGREGRRMASSRLCYSMAHLFLSFMKKPFDAQIACCMLRVCPNCMFSTAATLPDQQSPTLLIFWDTWRVLFATPSLPSLTY